MRVGAGTTAFDRVPSGSPGAWAWISAPPARRSAGRPLSPRCRGSPWRSPAASCRTPRSAPSRGWRRRTPRSGCLPSAAPARPGPWSASFGGGGAWDAKRGRGGPRRRHTSRALHVYPNHDGTTTIRGRLSPEAGALLLKALTAAREALYSHQRASAPDVPPTDSSAETPTLAQQQADALQLLAETRLHHGIDPGSPAEHYQVVVHVDASALTDPEQPGQSVVEDGARVSAETSQRLGCDASRVVMEHDAEGRIFDVGPKTRTIP